VRLDVRPVGEAGAIAALLPVHEIGIGDVRVDEDGGGLQRGERAVERLQPGTQRFGQFCHVRHSSITNAEAAPLRHFPNQPSFRQRIYPKIMPCLRANTTSRKPPTLGLPESQHAYLED
jgi:hypothetical protein